MSERGVFAVDRGIWGHPCFANEPFTEREAWQWLIGEAAFKPRKKRVGNTVFDLERGQLAASIRFMAEAWQWHRNKVHRFLVKLKTETMIEHTPGQDATLITICNYDKYQRVSLPDGTVFGTLDGTSTGHQRDKLEDTKNTEIDDAVATRASGSLVTPEAIELTEKLLSLAGHSPSFWPPGWCGAPMHVQKWLNGGWHPEIIVAAVKGAAARKRGPPANSVQFFENAIAEEVARQSSPLPTVEIRSTEKLTVIHGTAQSKPGSLIAAIDRELAALEAEERADFALSENPVRLISGRPIR